MTQTETVEIRDFTNHRVVRFRIDDDVFEGLPDLPAMLLVEFASAMAKLDETTDIKDQPKVFRDLFNMVLTDESAARFIERMSSKTEPISIAQIDQIMPWIMEQYGMRPTEPSSDSSTGSESPGVGTNLTVAALPEASTSESSEPNGS